jgi:hypothetical protein
MSSTVGPRTSLRLSRNQLRISTIANKRDFGTSSARMQSSARLRRNFQPALAVIEFRRCATRGMFLRTDTNKAKYILSVTRGRSAQRACLGPSSPRRVSLIERTLLVDYSPQGNLGGIVAVGAAL